MKAKSKKRYSQLMGYLGVGDFASAKKAAQTEQISPQTERMLSFMAPNLPCIYEIIRIVARRKGFRKCQKAAEGAADAYEGEAILNGKWDKLKVLIEDAPFCPTNLWALVCTIKDNLNNPQAEEVFKLYKEKYGFAELPWKEQPHAVMHRILAEIMEKYNL